MDVHSMSRWLDNWKERFDRKWEGRLQAYVVFRTHGVENTLEQTAPV